MFQRAQRKKARLRLAIEGPSGSGKSYSALLIAKGLAPGGKVAVIDTENGSASLYTHLMDFDVADLQPPYTPERYVELIEAASRQYDVLIIDSASHEWNGKGGCLDIHNAMPGNSFTNWAKVTPRHDAFIQALLQAPCHVICTMRTKESYVLEENDRGKQTPKKVGTEAVQRQGVAYEFSVVLTMDVSHQATSTKDRTGLFPVNHWLLPNEETGRKLAEWLDNGVDPMAQALEQARERIPACQSEADLMAYWSANSRALFAHPEYEATIKPMLAAKKAELQGIERKFNEVKQERLDKLRRDMPDHQEAHQ